MSKEGISSHSAFIVPPSLPATRRTWQRNHKTWQRNYKCNTKVILFCQIICFNMGSDEQRYLTNNILTSVYTVTAGNCGLCWLLFKILFFIAVMDYNVWIKVITHKTQGSNHYTWRTLNIIVKSWIPFLENYLLSCKYDHFSIFGIFFSVLWE